MNYLNQEQIDQLKAVNFEDILNTVINHSYAIGINCGFTQTLTKVYKECTGETLYNWNCNSCVMNNIKKVGKLYNESLEKIDNKKDDVELIQNNNNGKKSKRRVSK